MGGIHDVDLWCRDARGVDDCETDEVIVAAAHAGDIRAMLYIAAKVPDYLADGPEGRKAVRWYQKAAEYGSAEAAVRLAALIQSGHQRWHARRRYRDPFERQIIPGPEDLELCRAGADRGDADCAQVWAEHLRAQEEPRRDEIDEILDEIDEVLQENAEEFVRSYVQGGEVPVVLTAVITTGLVSFIQAMISKAGQDSYDALREHLRSLFTRSASRRGKTHEEDQVLVVKQSESFQDSAVLQIWTDLPDEAITALAQLLYDMRTAHPAESGTGRRWYWNGVAHRWQLLKEAPHQPQKPAGNRQQPAVRGVKPSWLRTR